MGVIRSVATATAAVAVLAAAGGCGDPALWARYRAERMLWYAQRAVNRADTATPAGYAEASRALERVVAAFPAERWLPPGSGSNSPGADVARVAAEAAMRRATLAREAGRHDEAAARFGSAARAYAALPDVAAPALAACARALEASASGAAASAWEAVLAHDGWERRPQWAEAAAASVRLRRAEGGSARADSLATVYVARLEAALETPAGGPATDGWRALAELREGLGDHTGARRALRRAHADPAAKNRRVELVHALVANAVRAEAPDTAAAYALWARGISPLEAFKAEVAVAGAWARAGVADSALAVYKRVIDGAPMGVEPSLRARFERARLLERRGAWDAARSEYRTLASLQPAHELAVAALLAIVRHHRSLSEIELAGIEGQRALETLDRLIAGYRDATVQRRASLARAEVLEMMGRTVDAGRAYADVWTSFPRDPEGGFAGLRAARIADSALADRDRARVLYEAVERGAGDATSRDRARAGLAGLH